jgi:hypothetical protein
MKQRSRPTHEILIIEAISYGKNVMCNYLVTRHDSVDGAFLGYVKAYPTLASAEAFLGCLNSCQILDEGPGFYYGIEVRDNLGQAKSDLLLMPHGLHGLI